MRSRPGQALRRNSKCTQLPEQVGWPCKLSCAVGFSSPHSITAHLLSQQTRCMDDVRSERATVQQHNVGPRTAAPDVGNPIAQVAFSRPHSGEAAVQISGCLPYDLACNSWQSCMHVQIA